MATLRWFILQTILVAAVLTLNLSGHLNFGESAWYVVGVAGLGWLGLLLVLFGRLDDAAKVQDLLPIVAVIAMQAGILSALAIMAQALMSSGDPASAVGGFFSSLSTALYVSVSALASYLWLRINLWLCHGE